MVKKTITVSVDTVYLDEIEKHVMLMKDNRIFPKFNLSAFVNEAIKEKLERMTDK